MTPTRPLTAPLTILAIVLAAGLATSPWAWAQDARVLAAQKEGKVVWYTSLALTSSEKVAKLFEAAYPGVKVEVHRTGSQRILQRVMQELAANIKNVDVVHTSDAGHYVLLKDKKLLMKHTPAGVESFPAGFKDKDGYHYGLRATVNVIAYNTKAVSAADAPRTWKDLLDPKWRASWSPRTRAIAASSPPTCSPSCTCTAGSTGSSSPRTSRCSCSRPSIRPAWSRPASARWR